MSIRETGLATGWSHMFETSPKQSEKRDGLNVLKAASNVSQSGIGPINDDKIH